MEKVSNRTIKRLKNKDESAFDEIFYKYSNLIYSVAYQYLKNKQDCEDCVQEVFIKLLENINQFKPEIASFDTWFLTLAKNHIINFKRNQLRYQQYVNVDNEKIDATMYFINHETELLIRELEELLGQTDYHFLVLRIVYRLSFKQIGLLYNMPQEVARRKFEKIYKVAKTYFSKNS